MAQPVARRFQRPNQSLIVKGLPYYSHGRFTAVKAGAGPFTFTIAAGTLIRLFGFAKGDDMAPAGRAGVFATEADTNLQTKSQTIDGEQVEIMGVALQITGQSDAALAQNLLRDLSVKVSLNGGDRAQLLGNAEMIPGANGFFAGPGSPATTAAPLATISNGWPSINNMYPVYGSLIWKPSGATDSSLVVLINCERANVLTTANNGTAGFVDLRCVLYGVQKAPRSVNI